MSDKMREEFEHEMRKLGMFERIGGECPMDTNKETGEYISADTGAMWAGFVIGWKASRAAICVNLPRQTYDYDLDCDTMIAHHVCKALDAAGVRYK